MTKTLKLQYDQEWEKGYDYRRAMEEAARCLLCYDAPCSKACPAGTDPAKFIRSLRFKNIYGGAETIRRNNPLGGTCAEVCPCENLCEEACSRCGIDQPINISKLQRFLVEQEVKEGMDFAVNAQEARGKTVACVGAGPASLSCAKLLAEQGYEVTVYEASKEPGGMLRYAIPAFRLPLDVVDYDIKLIKKAGVKIVCNKHIDVAGVNALKENNDAVFVGVGLARTKGSDLPGAKLNGIILALDFLRMARTGTLPELKNKKVVVIGGGDVAMDCAATAKVMGAKTALVYRRTREEAPATSAELDRVLAMGISYITEFVPVRFSGSKENLSGIVAQGRDGTSQLSLETDYVILAIGQELADDYDKLKKTPGIFLGGDMVPNAGHTVVEAVAMGKQAAADIQAYLEGGNK